MSITKKTEFNGDAEALINSCPAMMFVFGVNQELIFYSEAGERLLVNNCDCKPGATFDEVFGCSESGWAERAYQCNKEVCSRGEANSYEDKIYLRQGDINVQISVSLYKDATGETKGTIMMVDDISELAQVRRTAEDEARERSNFLANISHEIRTPINAIKGLSELLALTRLSGTQSSYVENIVVSTNALLSIVNDVLDFAKIDSDKAEIMEGNYSIEALMAEVCNVMNARVAEKGLKLYVELSPKLPVSLRGDDVRLKQIIINLLGNAIKYTQKGHITFRMYAGETVGDRVEIVCEIEDTGVGIKEEDLPRLFLPYSRADLLARRNISGTGLGLTISHKLADSMGGRMTVKSVYGKGSTFTVRLPQGIAVNRSLAQVENAFQKCVLTLVEEAGTLKAISDMLDLLGVAHENARARALAELEQGGYTHCIYDDTVSLTMIKRMRAHMPGCVFIAVKDMRYALEQSENYDVVLFTPLMVTGLARALETVPNQKVNLGRDKNIFLLKNTDVLIVDDNEMNLTVAGEILKSYNALVTYAEDGFKAVKLCEETKFDMIFMDHMMPGMDGIETALEIRHGGGKNKTTPIVALTAYVVPEIRNRYESCGMEGFLGKPLEISELNEVLRLYIPPEKIQDDLSAVRTCGENKIPGEESGGVMSQIINALDVFGMSVSEVMREIDNNRGLLLTRMERVRCDLEPVVAKMRRLVSEKNWDEFAVEINLMANMIHDIGARNCSERARRLSLAARKKNEEYVLSDFFSLMDNMYMLQKKMEVAVPLIKGEKEAADVPFGDKVYCYGQLEKMGEILEAGSFEKLDKLMVSLACYSLDHDLDLILIKIHSLVAKGDLPGAIQAHREALLHCENTWDM